MKEPNLNKIHFKDSRELLVTGDDVMANCGVIVKRAEFPYFLDIKELPLQEISAINLCLICLGIGERISDKHYRYGLVSRERRESLQGTEEAA